MNEIDELLRPVEVARKLRVDARTLANYRRDGRIRYYQLSPRTFRYHPGDVDAFIKSSSRDRQLSLF